MKRSSLAWILLGAFSIGAMLSGCDVLTSSETRMERASAFLQEGEYRGAEIELKKLLRKDPDHALARSLLGQAEFMLGDVVAAERDLERALESGASSDEAGAWLGRVYLATGRHQDLLDALGTGRWSLEPGLRAVLLGRAELAAGDLVAATEAFQEAKAAPRVATEALIGLAEVEARSGNLQSALASLSTVTDSDPGHAAAWLSRGRMLLQSGRAAEADGAFARAVQHGKAQLTEPEQMQALAGRLEAQLAQGQVDLATEILASLSARSPGSPMTRLLTARVAMSKGDFGEAGRILQGLATEMPDEGAVSFLLGSVLLAQGNLNQADRALSSVVSSRPENLEARKLLAETRLRMNRPEDAMAVLTPALQGQVTDPKAEALLAAAQVQSGADPTAVGMLEASVARNPQDLAARLQLASLYLSTANPGKAADLLRATASPADDRRRDALLIRAIRESRGEEAAQAELDRMLRERPADAEMLNVAAAHYLSIRKFGEATLTLDKALALRPGDAVALVMMAQARLGRGDLDGAEASLRRVLSRQPDSVPARLGMAEIASRRGLPDEAKRWLEEVRVSNSQAIGSRLMLARLYFADQDMARVDAILKEVQEAAPGRPDVLSALGALDLDLGRPESALSRFRQAADLEPQQAENWLGMARAQVALGYEAAARGSLERALEAEPTSERAVGHMVLFELRAGQREQALERVLELRKRLPGSASAASLEGDVRTALGQHAEAAAAYRAAASLQPRLYAVVREARARQRAGALDAEAPLEAWLREHPDDLDARTIFAIMLDGSGKHDRAVREYERVVAAGRASAVVANNLAWRYFEAGDERAEALARQARELAPDNASIADTLGWILLRKGSIEAAVPLLEEAAKRSPESWQIQLHYAEGLAAAGRRGEALAVAKRVLETFPSGEGRTGAEALLARLTG